jgi:PhnB protein
MQLAPYLFFDGTCEEALTFYTRVFDGKITALNRFEGSPMAESMPPEARNNVMHATFDAPGVTFMASDGQHGKGAMQRVGLSLASDDADEGRHIFDQLAEGGTVTLPYTKQFWGASFGMVIDRFGIFWLVNAGS